MKRVVKISLFVAFLMTVGSVTNSLLAQYSPTPMFIDELITVNRRKPNPTNFNQVMKKIKKNRTKIRTTSTFECQGYAGYRSKKITKREKALRKNRKKVMASVK